MHRATPPARSLARWILLRCSPDGTHVYGDLVEAYATRRARRGRRSANLWFVREVVLACWYGQIGRAADLLAVLRHGLEPALFCRAMRTLGRRPTYALTLTVLMGVSSGVVGALSGVERVIAGSSDPSLDSVRVIVGTDSERDWTTAYLSLPEIEDLRREVEAFGEVGAFFGGATLRFGRGFDAEPVEAVFADGSYFRVLNVDVRLGRTFTAAEAEGRTDPGVVLSHGFWRDALAARRDVLGRTLEIGGRQYTVLGVLDESFRDPARADRTDVWLPLSEAGEFFGAQALTSRTHRRAFAVAAASPATALDSEAVATRLARTLRREYPDAHRGRGFDVRTLRDWWFGSVERPLEIMRVAGIALVLLVLANVAALLRLRRQERAGDMVLRAALGASRGALLGTVLAEALVLVTAASTVGIVTAGILLRLQNLAALLGLPYFATPDVPAHMIVACAALIIPMALLAERRRAFSSIGAGARTARALLGAEAAVAASLLTIGGAALMATKDVADTSTGFQTEDLLTARLHLTPGIGGSIFAAASTDARIRFARELIDRAPTIGGIQSVALIGPSVLGQAEWHLGFVPEGVDSGERVGPWLAQRIVITPGGLRTIGVDILEGRGLEWRDRNPSAPVAVIDERIARTFWPEGDAVGSRFCSSLDCGTRYTVVGVAEVAKHRGRMALDRDVVGDVYLSYASFPTVETSLPARTDGPTDDVAGDLRALVADLAPWGLVSDVQWMEDRLRAAEALPRTTSAFLAAYAGVAVLLALIGTWGLVAVHVGRMWRGMALRLALGARPVILARRVVMEGVTPVMLGVALGTLVGLLASTPLTAMIFDTSGLGAWGWRQSTVVAGLMVFAAIGAAGLPLLRLNLLRPMEVLSAD